jgi:hypothetical protein
MSSLPVEAAVPPSAAPLGEAGSLPAPLGEQGSTPLPLGGRDVAGRRRGGPATFSAAAAGWASVAKPATGPEAVAAGGCCAWPLPLEATCADETGEVFRQAVAPLGVTGDLVTDGVATASELAAKTLHAHQNADFDGEGASPLAGAPELWIYLRRAGSEWELVCKVFDSLCRGPDGGPPAAGGGAANGHGLAVVAGLSSGRWGSHLTRSRLGGWKVPGKAVWFAQPVPGTVIPGPLRHTRLAPARAARALGAMLADRGLGANLLCTDGPGAAMSVLSVRHGLTVWCREDVIWWRAADGRYQRRVPTDLVDITEQLVWFCAELENGASSRHAILGQPR